MTSTCSRGAITKRHVCGCAILHHLQHEFMWLCNSNSYWSHVSFETSLIQTVRSYRWPRHVWLSIANLTSWYAVLPVLFLSFLVFLFSAMLATYYKIFISVIRSNQQWSPVISFFWRKKKQKQTISMCRRHSSCSRLPALYSFAHNTQLSTSFLLSVYWCYESIYVMIIQCFLDEHSSPFPQIFCL